MKRNNNQYIILTAARRSGLNHLVMFTSHIPQFSRDFSAKTLKALAEKGVFICGQQAVQAHPGDTCLCGIAYVLAHEGKSFIRSHSQVLAMAASSWRP